MDFQSIDEYEDEYDVFYDELRRQVLQLTADDDDVYEKRRLEARGKVQSGGPFSVHNRNYYYHYDWPGIKEDCGAAPAWMLSLWRSGSGTGVFIPQTVHYGIKYNRSRRRKNERGITHKQPAAAATMTS